MFYISVTNKGLIDLHFTHQFYPVFTSCLSILPYGYHSLPNFHPSFYPVFTPSLPHVHQFYPLFTSCSPILPCVYLMFTHFYPNLPHVHQFYPVSTSCSPIFISVCLVIFSRKFLKYFYPHGMALLKYFNRVNGSTGTPLPNPESSLNEVVDWKAIEAANKEVMKVCSKGPKGVIHRLSYLKAAPKQKAPVGKYAVENGVMHSIRRFQNDFPQMH